MDGSYFENTDVETNFDSAQQQQLLQQQAQQQQASINPVAVQNDYQQRLETNSIYPQNEVVPGQNPVSKTEEIRAKLGKEPMDLIPQFQSMPTLFLIVVIFYFVLAPILMLRMPELEDSGHFLQTQMWMNCSLVVTFSVIYGILTLGFPDTFITKYRNFLLPVVLIVLMWLKGYFVYQNSLVTFCEDKEGIKAGTKNDGSIYNINVLIWNTSKVPIAIFVTYIFIVLFPQTVVPFNEFFCGEEVPHPLVEFFSIGFWIGCATWPSEASCYFEAIRDGCEPAGTIQFERINDEVKQYNDSN